MVTIDRARRPVVTRLRFLIVYSCSRRGAVRLQVVVSRPDDAWPLVPRIPSTAVGFSEWFGGPIGHDFHVTGVLSSDSATVSGTIHSRLGSARRLGRCDSGVLRYRARSSSSAPAAAPLASITLAQYRALPSHVNVGEAERRLGAPDDRDSYRPRGLITSALPSGVPGSHIVWLDYVWRGHPNRYFQFFFRAGRLISGSPGRSIVPPSAANRYIE